MNQTNTKVQPKLLTQEQLNVIFEKVTTKFLKNLVKNPIITSERNQTNLGWGAAFFPQPTTWDINNGLCEEWAEAVEDKIPGSYMDYETVDENTHAILYYNGKFYDAECWEGLKDSKKLPIFKNHNRTRLEVLTERVNKRIRL